MLPGLDEKAIDFYIKYYHNGKQVILCGFQINIKTAK
jgi:hypothetical protein